MVVQITGMTEEDTVHKAMTGMTATVAPSMATGLMTSMDMEVQAIDDSLAGSSFPSPLLPVLCRSASTI